MPKNAHNDNEILEAISDLTGAVGSRFDKVDERFDKVDERLNSMDQKLDRIESIILKDHERRLEQLERKAGIAR